MSIGPAREGYCNKHRLHRKPCLVCAAEATPAPPLRETGPSPEAVCMFCEWAKRGKIVAAERFSDGWWHYEPERISRRCSAGEVWDALSLLPPKGTK